MEFSFCCSRCAEDAPFEGGRVLAQLTATVPGVEDFTPFRFVCTSCSSTWNEVELMDWLHTLPQLRSAVWRYCEAASTVRDSDEASKAHHCVPAYVSWTDDDFSAYVRLVDAMGDRIGKMPEDAFALLHLVDVYAEDHPRRAGRLIGLCLTRTLEDHEPFPDLVFVIEDSEAWQGVLEGDVGSLKGALEQVHTEAREPAEIEARAEALNRLSKLERD